MYCQLAVWGGLFRVVFMCFRTPVLRWKRMEVSESTNAIMCFTCRKVAAFILNVLLATGEGIELKSEERCAEKCWHLVDKL